MTKVFRDEYKGHKMFSVWEVDAQGEKSGKSPVVAFAIRKARAIATHVEELKEFVAENPGDSVAKYDTEKLSNEEKDQLTQLLGKMS